MPGFAKIKRSFDVHSCGAECFEPHDQMSKAELGFKIKLNINILHSILGLPPSLFPVASERWHYISDSVAHSCSFIVSIILPSWVALEALRCVIEMANYTVLFRIIQTTCGIGQQTIFTTNKQISDFRIASSPCTGVLRENSYNS